MKRYYVDKIILYFMTLLITAFSVCLSWQALEVVLYHEVQPRIVDDIIGVILIIALWTHIKRRIDEWLVEKYKMQGKGR